MLRRHAARGETRHAYLFCGPPGVGRRTLALKLAQAINCETPIAPGEPCNACRNCKQIGEMRHPDLSVIFPTIPDPNDRKILIPNLEAGIIRVEQIRDFRHLFALKPYQSQYRVALFVRFHQSNENAANALLKTLEEAPAHAILLLTADTPEQLLPTIISRCEILRLRPLSVSAIQADLMQRGESSERANLLAHLSGGRPGFARRLAEDSSFLEQRAEMLDDLQTLLSASRVQKFAYAEKMSKDKDAMRQTILTWLSYWRDVMLRAVQSQTPLINEDLTMEIESLAGRVNLPAARKTVRRLENALSQMEQNVNTRLLAEVLLMDLPKV